MNASPSSGAGLRTWLVIAASKPWTCTTCVAEFDAGRSLTMEMRAALHGLLDLGHLEFLPAGNAALTRRARSLSGLSAVVVRWSRRAKRYERQGILAEPEAIEHAEAQCLAEGEVRERRRLGDELHS